MAAARLVTPILVKMLLRWARHRLLADDELGGDHLVRRPGGDPPEHFDLAPGQRPTRRRLPDPGTELLDGSEIGVGAERPEDALGNVERGVAAVVLVQCTAGPGVEHVRHADLVGAAEVLPEADRCGGALTGRRPVAVGEIDPCRANVAVACNVRVPYAAAISSSSTAADAARPRSRAATATSTCAGSSRARHSAWRSQPRQGPGDPPVGAGRIAPSEQEQRAPDVGAATKRFGTLEGIFCAGEVAAP